MKYFFIDLSRYSLRSSHTGLWSWDYCSKNQNTRYGRVTTNLIDIQIVFDLIILYPQECANKCSKRNEIFFWCYDTLGGWDYCSPSDWNSPKSSDDMTIYNENCLTACDTYGESYFWCW